MAHPKIVKNNIHATGHEWDLRGMVTKTTKTIVSKGEEKTGKRR